MGKRKVIMSMFCGCNENAYMVVAGAVFVAQTSWGAVYAEKLACSGSSQ